MGQTNSSDGGGGVEVYASIAPEVLVRHGRFNLVYFRAVRVSLTSRSYLAHITTDLTPNRAGPSCLLNKTFFVVGRAEG